MTRLVLASTSPSRRELLARLRVPFEAVSPDYEEVHPAGLGPAELAQLHSQGKALSVAERFPGAVVVGSDQVAELDGTLLGKPGSVEGAVHQLQQMSGRWVAFHTGLAVARGETLDVTVETYRVRVRTLTSAEINRYVAAERPLNCAGSFRIEGQGIALMEELEGRDYTALIGLPLIALSTMLRTAGIGLFEPLPGSDQE